MKVDLVLQGEVQKRAGVKKLVLAKPEYYKQQIDQFFDGEKVELFIKKKKRKRSLNVNAYWWGVCFPILSDLTGFTIEEVHELTKRMFILPKIKRLPKNKDFPVGREVEVPRGTSDLSSSEAWEFTTKLIFLASELGGRILTPCEAGYSCGRSDCEICAKEMSETKIAYPKEESDVSSIPF